MRDNNHPLVSVITPTYNRVELLPRAIQSVLTQDFGDLELIIIDDGSDDTPRVVGEICDPRIQYVHREHKRGIGSARNEGLSRAKGDFIAFIDADDVWLPGKLRYQIELIQKYAQVDVLFSDYRNINYVTRLDRRGFELMERGFRNIKVKALEPDFSEITAGFPEALVKVNIIGTCSMVVVRRNLFKTVGDFDGDLAGCEDLEFWWRASLGGGTFAYSTRCLIERHKDARSDTSQHFRSAGARLQALERCDRVARKVKRLDLIEHTNEARYRTLYWLIREFGLRGDRAGALGAFRQSLRYRRSPRALMLLLTAMMGKHGTEAVIALRRMVCPKDQ